MEKSFELAEVKDDKKAKYASYYQKDEASFGWESTKALQKEEVISWQKFTKLFLENYLPRYMQDQLELGFLELKQENIQYPSMRLSFPELARFLPEYVNTEAKKTKIFYQGLKSWIRSQVALLELRIYVAVV
ncbi:uncharacterized protein LOC141665450 [Apium graveolens]|uniref:uncharacterized protein LOC141665450 n=1 Tax=Apium graveolens TaxID=4045 RepID=UPI003D7B487E